ncbi:MAG: methylated-DNA--[protein]-cysteine S-methyltransferase [Planctomycetota bacterium]
MGTFETPWGAAGAAGRGEVLVRVLLPVRGGKKAVLRRLAGEFPGARVRSKSGAPVLTRLGSFLAGEGPAPPVDLAGFSPFLRETLEWIGTIPRGRVATYGSIARWMGREGAARGVGQASAGNPVPLVIPCHRVVGSQGQLVGFSADGGLALKARLLAWEGVVLSGRPGRVGKDAFLREKPRRGKGRGLFAS